MLYLILKPSHLSTYYVKLLLEIPKRIRPLPFFMGVSWACSIIALAHAALN